MLTTPVATKEIRSSIKMTTFKLALLPLCDENQTPHFDAHCT
jgi:hypothetical protein